MTTRYLFILPTAYLSAILFLAALTRFGGPSQAGDLGLLISLPGILLATQLYPKIQAIQSIAIPALLMNAAVVALCAGASLGFAHLTPRWKISLALYHVLLVLSWIGLSLIRPVVPPLDKFYWPAKKTDKRTSPNFGAMAESIHLQAATDETRLDLESQPEAKIEQLFLMWANPRDAEQQELLMLTPIFRVSDPSEFTTPQSISIKVRDYRKSNVADLAIASFASGRWELTDVADQSFDISNGIIRGEGKISKNARIVLVRKSKH